MSKTPFIDRKLLDKALEVGGETAIGNRSRRERVARRDRQRLLDLFGTLDWDDAYDYKRERTRQRFPS